MNLFNPPPPPAPEASVVVAVREILASIEVEAQRVSQNHARIFNLLWSDPHHTPDALLAQMQEQGDDIKMLTFAARNIAHIAGIATDGSIPLETLISEADYQPRRAFAMTPEGQLYLEAPAEGYDAWGRLIPVPEPEEPIEEEPSMMGRGIEESPASEKPTKG